MDLFRKKKKQQVEFDEIFLDASNLPSFNISRMEGRMELPINRWSIFAVGGVFILICIVFFFQLFSLQVTRGSELSERSDANKLQKNIIIAERGVVYDRNGELLAWNEVDNTGEYDFPVRAYSNRQGLGQLIGYVSYPKRDKYGFYFRTEYIGRNGIEEAFNTLLQGENGEQLTEIDAHGLVISENVVRPTTSGSPLTLSVDAELSEVMYDILATTTAKTNFRSGAAVIMDVETGEIVAHTSFPSYDPEIMADGDDVEAIKALNNDDRFPFLDKVIGGVYTPGSIVKPFLAYGALAEKIISPDKIIVSNGYILVPNPYDRDNPTRFNDWRVQGKMTMREAIAFSSNVYFYTIGGGSEDQEGLGISRINTYTRKFGFGNKTGITLLGEQAGTVPNPAWKREVFDDDWRLGDTYLTSIGQFGFQVSPLQMVRAYSAIANGGKLFVPHFIKDTVGEYIDLNINQDDMQVVRDGMRMTVNYPRGTARPLERNDVAIAAKSGTAELNVSKAFVNTWVAGYFPYEKPRYAFVLLMERGPRNNTVGATRVMNDVIEWMSENRTGMLEITDITNVR